MLVSVSRSARVLHLLAAYAPARVAAPARAAARALHVFARAPGTDYARVDVPRRATATVLKEAVIAKLQLGVPPHCVRLELEAEGGGPPTALDSRTALSAQRVRAGASLTAHLVQPPQAVPMGAPMLPELPLRVMARGPDPHLDVRLLAALRDPLSTPSQRLDALSELVRDTLGRAPAQGMAFDALPLYNTEAHGAVLGVVLDHARELMRGGFRGRNGLPCRTLVGARGIGKTVILRAFALVAASVFPGLIPLYVSAASVQSPCTSFQVAPLDRFMALAALQRGAAGGGAGAGSSGAPSAPLEATLRSQGQRMLILLDEVDQLYKLQPGSAAAENVLFSMGTLSDLAEEATGEFGVLLCGSSSSTFKLLCGATSPHLRARFPLSTSGANLKSDKFERVLLPSAPCTATREVAQMLAVLMCCRELPEALLPQARLLTFFVGAKPRAVEIALSRGKDARVVQLNLGAATPAALSDGSMDSPPAHALYHLAMDLLLARNQRLCALVGQASGQASLVSLMDPGTPWEAVLQPLPWEVLVAAWARARGSAVPGEGDTAELAVLLDDLSDRHALHRRHTPEGVEVWPVTAAQLVARSAGSAGPAWLKNASAEALGVLAPLVQLLQAAASVAAVAGALK